MGLGLSKAWACCGHSVRHNAYRDKVYPKCIGGPRKHDGNTPLLVSLFLALVLTNLFFFLFLLTALFFWFLLSPFGTPRTSQG